MGRALRGLGQIPIRRGAGAWDPLEQMADVIREAGWVASPRRARSGPGE